MGWDGIFTKTRPKRARPETTAAVAVAAAQLPALFLLWWIHDSTADTYGRDYGGAFGLLCLFVLAPVYLPVLGLLHACVQILPGAALADLASGRVRWFCQLPGAVLVGTGWAAVSSALWGAPFVITAPVLAGLGVLPVLAMAYARRREWGTRGIWWRAATGSVALSVLALAGGLVATATGLIEEYEPPRLSAARVTGVWRGANGSELRLLPGGRAELTRMPVRDSAVCDGTGTWSYEKERAYDSRDGVVVRLGAGSGTGSGCGDETAWTIGGTERAPELFVILGDPDNGDLCILKPAVAA
ncbi:MULTISPECIES: hypothetical protein [Streptomyces]|uniref:Integral membrane protein n=2 Tax=Streptomyces TaxID=1883 RepID=A0ABV9IW75_9ACTN